jgi:hypothetical protein
MDYLRQYSECRADLTPLELYYSESARRLMVDFEGFHTCRLRCGVKMGMAAPSDKYRGTVSASEDSLNE